MEANRRRSTTDHINHTWSICQYYFTHNNGSSDDVLLRDSLSLNKSQLNKVSKRHLHQLERSYTYPQEKRLDVVRELGKKTDGKRRRWTTIKRKQKRQTLANILSDLSRTATMTGNISQDASDVSSSSFGRSSNIKQYNPQLDNEKILEDDHHSPFPQTSLQRKTTNTTATLYNDLHSLRNSYQSTIKMNTYYNNRNNNQATSSHMNNNNETQQEDDVDANCNNITVITLPNMTEDIQAVPEIHAGPYLFEKKLKLHSDKDMLLFIVGFLVFPVWWYGTYRYFTQDHLSILSKRQRCFQLLNYLSSIASLLILGLIVGLVTVWA